ncbi:MAG: glycosyltransferase [Candidatus Eremiobacteraeota bacterium]|nr:glycosyltransferase [Candidatus Eremiobacteraeota bacterium]
MKLALITARFPFGKGEAFLAEELGGLAGSVQSITVIPVRPKGHVAALTVPKVSAQRLGLVAPRTLGLALHEMMRHPHRVAALFLEMMRQPASLSTRLKNLSVFPKGLAVAAEVRRLGFDHVHAYWLSTPATVGYIAASLTNVRWSITAHRWDIYENNLIPLKAASAQAIRVISKRGEQELHRCLDPAVAQRVHVVHIGVSNIAEASPPSSGEKFSLLCAANFVPVKGHTYLLQALSALADSGVQFHCTLAGDGPLRPTLARAIRAHTLEGCVTMRGHLAHHVLLDELRRGSYDVMVLASTEDASGLMEGIPVALIEAMAAGIPCVATRTGSIPELIDSTCGILVAQKDPAALAQALLSLAHDPRQRERLAWGALARVRAAFNIQRTSRDLAALFRTGQG